MTPSPVEPTSAPRIALVGRPNVGKSTLFNRLIGARKAVVSSVRGTTRDRIYGEAIWRGAALTLIDTGGVEFAGSDRLAAAVQRHVQRALDDADGFVFVCDAQEGLVPADEMLMERLHKTGKPVLLAVNKSDDRLTVPPEFYAMAAADVFPVSALHGRGTGELLDGLVKQFGGLPPSGAPAPAAPVARMPAVAIIGRQNVGKSSLLNALLREERVIVSDTPGTTRDAIDTQLQVNGSAVLLIDTAGLRHRRKVRSPVDMFSMSRSLEAIGRCDTAVVVLDSVEGVTQDDRRIVAQVADAGRGLVLAFNKWDLLERGNERALAETAHRLIPAATGAPVAAVSAKTGFHVFEVLAAARRVCGAMARGLTQEEAGRLINQAWSAQPVPRFRGRLLRLQGVRWICGRPSIVELTLAPSAWLPPAYQRYLLKRLRRHPPLAGVPVRLSLRLPERGEPKR